MDALKQIFADAREDNITGEAAKVAYYLFLSLFPFILVLLSLTGLVGGDQAFQWIMGRIQQAVPPETAGFLERFVREITDQPRPGVFSIGLLLTLWAASGGISAPADGLNVMFDVGASRGWVRKRATALAVLLVAVLLLTGGAFILIAGPAIARATGLGPIWSVLSWPIAFLMLAALFYLIYYTLPDRDQSRSRLPVLIGAVAGAAAWLLATLLFRLYITNFGSYSATYGFVGAIIVLMLWLYLTALAILFGGEIASAAARRMERGEREATNRAA